MESGFQKQSLALAIAWATCACTHRILSVTEQLYPACARGTTQARAPPSRGSRRVWRGGHDSSTRMFTCSSTNSCFYLESWHCYLKVSYTTGPCLKSHFCLSKIGIKADNVILFSPYLQCTLAEGVFIVRRHCCELAIPKRLRRQQDSSTKLARGSGQQCSGGRGNLLAVSLKRG